MKTSEVYNDRLHRGKPRGYYDPSPMEVFFTKVGQAIFKFTDDNQHKTQMKIGFLIVMQQTNV
mgnify:CR=1 FL=1